MKVLFTVQPLFGHFHAMAPLALALKGHGHEVAFATGQSFGSTVRYVGFQHFPCGLDLSGEPHGIRCGTHLYVLDEDVDRIVGDVRGL